MGEPGTGTLLLVLDLVGTFVFALSGASAGVKNRLDLFGRVSKYSTDPPDPALTKQVGAKDSP
jgi:Glycine transporter